MSATKILLLGVNGDGRLTEHGVFHYPSFFKSDNEFAESFAGTAILLVGTTPGTQECKNWMISHGRQICLAKSNVILADIIDHADEYDVGDITVMGSASLVKYVHLDEFCEIYAVGPEKYNSEPNVPGMSVVSRRVVGGLSVYTMGPDLELTEENVGRWADAFLSVANGRITEKDIEIRNKTLEGMEELYRRMSGEVNIEHSIDSSDGDGDLMDDFRDDHGKSEGNAASREVLAEIDKMNDSFLDMATDLSETIKLITGVSDDLKEQKNVIKRMERDFEQRVIAEHHYVMSELRDIDNKHDQSRTQFTALRSETILDIEKLKRTMVWFGSVIIVVMVLVIIGVILSR